MQALETGYVWKYWKDTGGSISPGYYNLPFYWVWRDPGTYRQGENYKVDYLY